MNKTLTISILLLTCGCYVSEELPADQDVWPYANPSAVQLDEQELLSLDRMLQDGEFDQIRGMIIIKDDQLVFENYYNSGSRNEIRPIGRGTFSILAVAFDLFIRDGYIQRIDEPIYKYLPEYEMIFEQDEQKQLITFEHLLTHRSGLVWNETIGSLNNDLSRMKQNADWVDYILSKPLEAPPGLRKVINNGSGHLLSRIFQNVLGAEDLKDYLHDNLFSPIGIERVEWLESPDGIPDGSAGLFMTTMDLTRIGYLLLHQGRWTDRQRVIATDWVVALGSEQVEVSTDYSLGYAWYLFSRTRNQMLSLSDNTFFLSGETGQSLYILPDRNMVICIMADNYYSSLFNPSFSVFVRILNTMEHQVVN